MYMKKLLTLIIFLFFVTIVIAQPPTSTIEAFPQGYVIVEAQQPVLKTNEPHTYYFFLYNTSNGIPIDNETVNCSFYMANELGELLIEGASIFQPNGYWYRHINGTYFADPGLYSYGVNCQNDYGGALAGNFEVTPTGHEFSVSQAIMALIVFMFLITILLVTYKGIFSAENMEWIIAYMCIFYLVLFFTIYLMWIFSYSYLYDFDLLVNTLWIFWLLLGFGFLPFLFIIGLYIFINSWNYDERQKLINMGYTDKEAKTLTRNKK